MTVWRWAALAGLGCLALAVAYLPPQPSDPLDAPLGARTTERARVDRLDEAYRRAREDLRDAQFRDSLRRALSGTPRTASPITVVVRVPISEASRRQIRLSLEHVWERLEPVPDARIAVLVNVIRSPTTYVLPSALDGRTCVASISLDWSGDWFRPSTRQLGSDVQWLRHAIAPCLYYAAFGRPGPAIDAWLQRRALRPAYQAGWDAPPPPLPLLDEPGRYDFLRSRMSFDALACSDGDLSRCRAALLDPGRDELVSPGIAALVHRRWWSFSFPDEEGYLAALVHEMGRERFARFWRSSAPVDSAFLQAFEQPIDAWTARWARRWASDVPPFSPAPRPVAVVFGLALAAVALGVTLGYAARRQVA
jgi:hypothetical protein